MSDRGTAAVEVARERVGQALAELSRLHTIRKSAALVKKHATTVDEQAELLATQLHRLLLQTQTADRVRGRLHQRRGHEHC